jgi:flagellar basal-body rod protein FlgB
MSLDGNTVDDEIERKNFMENSLRYQMNLTFISNKSSELLKAIKGE